jgi:hypothetical protein
VHRAAPFVALAALSLLDAGCGAAPAAPAPPAATAAPAALDISGTWSGTGTDAQGGETFRWSVMQSGNRISGNVALAPADPNDGTCGSCHKQKSGTLSGMLNDGTLTLTLDFPSGGSDITPLCGITMTATTSDIAAGRISASYTGTTTCEGPISDGKLTVSR